MHTLLAYCHSCSTSGIYYCSKPPCFVGVLGEYPLKKIVKYCWKNEKIVVNFLAKNVDKYICMYYNVATLEKGKVLETISTQSYRA